MALRKSRIRLAIVVGVFLLILIFCLDRREAQEKLITIKRPATRLHRYDDEQVLPAPQVLTGAQYLTSPPVRRFWTLFNKQVAASTPGFSVSPPMHMWSMAGTEDSMPDLGADPDHLRFNNLFLSDKSFAALQSAHDGFVEALPSLVAHLPIHQKTRGIVVRAGWKTLSTVLLSVNMLRREESTLPVTVFLDDKVDHNEVICEEMLPPLGADCVVLTTALLDGFPAAGGRKLKREQFRPLVMLLAPYEQILYLDGDTLPPKYPDGLFLTEPFASTGLVTWPEAEVSTASWLAWNITRAGPVPALTERRRTSTAAFLYSTLR